MATKMKEQNTPQNFNIKSQNIPNDALENVSPFNYAYVGCLCSISGWYPVRFHSKHLPCRAHIEGLLIADMITIFHRRHAFYSEIANIWTSMGTIVGGLILGVNKTFETTWKTPMEVEGKSIWLK